MWLKIYILKQVKGKCGNNISSWSLSIHGNNTFRATYCKTKISGGFVSKLNNLMDEELERKAEVDASKRLSGKIKKE